MSISNVSTRLRTVRGLAELSARALDRLAHRPVGTAAIIEGRSAEGIRRHVADSYARALGVEVAWLMLGVGPCIAEAPHLDPEVPEHREAISVHLRAAVARSLEPPPAAPGEIQIVREGYDQSGAEG